MRAAFALLAALALAGCDLVGADRQPAEPTEISVSPLTEAVIQQSNAFGVSLFAQVAAEDDENLMLSPLSASAALTMLLNGADGETYAQIREMLGYSSLQDLGAVNTSYQSLRAQLLAADPEVDLALANAVFHRPSYPLLAPFVERLTGAFDARVDALDFGSPSAVGAINGWASEQTRGRIPTVIDEINPNTVLFLLNALYFKGAWTTSFAPGATRPDLFRRADGRTVTVPMMSERKLPVRAVGRDGYAAVELPYGRRNFSMVLMMPYDEQSACGGFGPDVSPADFAARLNAGLWAEATALLDAQATWEEVPVTLPRFSFSTRKTLNDQLQTLGMVDAFTGAADLSRMSDAGGMVSFVQQDTFIAVDEAGTEAAAVTTVAVAVSCEFAFFANRPFVFAIRERTTNTLLFIGQVTDPSL